MQLRWRRNPKTPDGWFKRIAIAMLAGLGAFLLSLPIGFFLFLKHFESVSPKDTQNLLSALTASVVLSVSVAAIAFAGSLGFSLLSRLVKPSPQA